jgi:hypothetical protein
VHLYGSDVSRWVVSQPVPQIRNVYAGQNKPRRAWRSAFSETIASSSSKAALLKARAALAGFFSLGHGNGITRLASTLECGRE